jgi:hypothetical protein
MRSGAVIPILIILSIAIGGILYLYGGSAFHQTFSSATTYTGTPDGNFTILAQGEKAAGIEDRVNYRITDESQFEILWYMIYTTSGPAVPNVDFSKKEVLAVFDGSHSTGGYGIRINSVQDVKGTRVISITHRVPGDSCSLSNTPSSPFMLVVVDKTPLSLDHEEAIETNHCQ